MKSQLVEKTEKGEKKFFITVPKELVKEAELKAGESYRVTIEKPDVTTSKLKDEPGRIRTHNFLSVVTANSSTLVSVSSYGFMVLKKRRGRDMHERDTRYIRDCNPYDEVNRFSSESKVSFEGVCEE